MKPIAPPFIEIIQPICLLMFLLLLLSGCGPAALPSPTPIETAAPEATLTASEQPTQTLTASAIPSSTARPTQTLTPVPSPTPHPLMISGLRQRIYPGSAITLEQPLEPGSNYTRQVVSYLSDGLKIYALLTIPNGVAPDAGWPAIVFNHGYIAPTEYRTTERYVAYVDALARSGFVVIKADYRGHGNSEGQARGGYGVPDYTVDVLNALASIERYPGVDPARIGMWGHSMGGMITLRAMVIRADIRAGVIWGGVVAPYADLLSHWKATPPATLSSGASGWRQGFIGQYGSPEENPDFWNAISPDSYLADLSGPLQLHHAKGDEEVPVAFSENLYAKAQAQGAKVELYLYESDNHNISNNFSLAMQRTIAFFKENLR
jgi:dipeptidyl aminopeptidase/acylaminoacyl peptidase